MIRGIIFDCFGVLYGGSLPTLLSLCPPEQVSELRNLNKQSDYGYITSDEYVSGIAALLNRPESEIEAILREKHARNIPLIEYVRSLRIRSPYKVALLSNVGSGVVERLFSSAELDELFDEVILSYREHVAKPNPVIYEMMADRLGIPPSECVMIDDLASNCEGAEIAGMQAIQYITMAGMRDELSKLLQQ